MTKVQAVVAVLKKKGGSATWADIYKGIEAGYPDYRKSKFWQEGIRGVVYREIRVGVTFEKGGNGIIKLKK